MLPKLSLEQTIESNNGHSPQFTKQTGFIVLNPVAGDGNPDKIKTILRSTLGDGRYDLYETTGEEPLPTVVQTAVSENSYAWVAAIGGDGTVSQVANGLVRSDVPLAIIPAGTGNALAKTLNIPLETEAACQLLQAQDSAVVQQIDGIQLEKQTLFLHMGVGLESVTMEKTSSAQKNRWGALAYLATVVKEAFGWQPHQFRLTVDGDSYDIHASEVVIANASEIGVLGLEWEKTIAPDDGRLDIAVIQARSIIDYLQLFWALLRGKQAQARPIQFYQAYEAIRLDAKRPLPLHGDGEVLEADWPLTAVVAPNILNVIVPQNK